MAGSAGLRGCGGAAIGIRRACRREHNGARHLRPGRMEGPGCLSQRGSGGQHVVDDDAGVSGDLVPEPPADPHGTAHALRPGTPAEAFLPAGQLQSWSACFREDVCNTRPRQPACRAAQEQLDGVKPRFRYALVLVGTGTRRKSLEPSVAARTAPPRARPRLPFSWCCPCLLKESSAWASSSRYTPAATTGSSTVPATSISAGAPLSARNGDAVSRRMWRSHRIQSARSSAPQHTQSTGTARESRSAPAPAS
jgi:hypothetical protein